MSANTHSGLLVLGLHQELRAVWNSAEYARRGDWVWFSGRGGSRPHAIHQNAVCQDGGLAQEFYADMQSLVQCSSLNLKTALGINRGSPTTRNHP